MADRSAVDVNAFLFETLESAVQNHADSLVASKELADRFGGSARVACSGKVKSGPLSGQTIEISIAINPEE